MWVGYLVQDGATSKPLGVMLSLKSSTLGKCWSKWCQTYEWQWFSHVMSRIISMFILVYLFKTRKCQQVYRYTICSIYTKKESCPLCRFL